MSLKDLLFQKKSKMFLYVFGVLIASTTNIISTYGMSHAFSVLETESQGEVLSILLVTAILMILPALIQLASRMLRIGFMSDTLKSVRSLGYEKIMRKDIESFSSIEKEVYQSAMISDVNLFEKDFFLSVLNIGFALFSSIFSFILLFRYSWVVATISLTTSILLYMVSKLFENKVRDARKRTQERNQSFNTLSSNLISGFKTIKSFASEKVFFNRFSDEIESLESVKAEFFGLNKNQELISHGISSMATIIIFIIASALMYSDQIRISELIVVLNLSGSLIWGMINAISFVNRLKSSVDIYNSLVDVEEVNQKRGLNLGDCVLNVSDLSFSYGDKLILDKLNFKLHKNEKLLIHGPSGTGKTTLINCLSQNQKGYEGTIVYGNNELSEVDHRSFLDRSAYIRQSHFMFDDSIKNNIILDCEYDEEKFKKVLIQSALNEWIDELELGSDHLLLKNGSNVSGGQRQRISIARELYSDYDIIFIDEPSSSLDDDNAERIYDTILALNKTVICVSHRHLDYLKCKFDSVISFEEVIL